MNDRLPLLAAKERKPMGLPCIDLQPLRDAKQASAQLTTDDPTVRDTVLQIHNALQELGFFTVRNHGVSQELQSNLEQQSSEFFAQDEATKQQIKMEHAGLAWKGYFPVGTEFTSGRPDQKAGLYFGTELPADHPTVQQRLPMHGPNQWPSYDDGSFRSTVLDYMEAMTNLGSLLMEAVALGLGLPPYYFSERFTTDPTRLFRIFYYPPHTWEEQEDEWGVREHTDMGFLTLLKQDDCGGLQVKGRQGAWIDVPPSPDTFIVNIGDMLELWTWGILKANPHRVRNQANRGRLSFPFFYDPNWKSTLERIDQHLLPLELLSQASSSAEARWDGLELHRLNADTTYGEFVWSKIRNVFPHLVPPGL